MAAIKFDTKKKVTSDLPIKPIKEYNNLVVGEIISVEVTEKVSESKNNYQYKGMSIPNLVIRFKQSINSFNTDDRYSVQVFKPVVTVKNSGEMFEEKSFTSIVMSQFDHIKHQLDQYEGLANFTEIEGLGSIDYKASTEELLIQFKAFYEALAKAFAGKDGKGVYKGVQLATKFIVNKGEKSLQYPNYVNKGYTQLAKFDAKGGLITTLTFYGETVEIPKVDANAQPGMPMGAMPAGVSAQMVDLNSVI